MIETSDYRLKMVVGQFGDEVAPIVDDITQVLFFDVQLKPGKHFQHRLPPAHHSFLYVFEGEGRFNRQNVSLNTLIKLGTKDTTPEFIAGKQGARFLLIGGRPINEPIIQYGPFVMNSKEEIDQAMRDFQTNNFVRDRAWMRRTG